MELNHQQKEAVSHKDGPILVIAGAGTGKTRIITERIAYILKQQWCRNDQILALTFTDKAAGEIEERIDTLMPLGYEAVPIHTFHSFCDHILKNYGIDIGISPGFKILQGVDLWLFVKEHLFEFELNYYLPLGNPTKFIDALISHFSRLKEEVITHMAGAETEQAIGSTTLVKLIKEAGRVAIERDTLYNTIQTHE